MICRQLDDGVTIGWCNTTGHFPQSGDRVHPDVFRRQAWGLLHTAGVFTHAHHDSDGDGTFVRIEAGTKFWGLMFPKSENIMGRTGMDALFSKNMPLQLATCQQDWDILVIELRPGDILLVLSSRITPETNPFTVASSLLARCIWYIPLWLLWPAVGTGWLLSLCISQNWPDGLIISDLPLPITNIGTPRKF